MNDDIKLQVNMAKIETKLEALGQKFEEHNIDQKSDINNIKDIISDFIKSADEKYAPIWAANAIKWVVGIVIFEVITAVVALVIIK